MDASPKVQSTLNTFGYIQNAAHSQCYVRFEEAITGPTPICKVYSDAAFENASARTLSFSNIPIISFFHPNVTYIQYKSLLFKSNIL